MARYNRLANETLYAACAELDEDELKQSRPSFFGSIHRTLNHILLGDRIWLGRFEGEVMASTELDAVLYEDFAELRHARVAEDARLEAFAANLDRSFLEGTVHYRNHAGQDCTDPKPLCLVHLFNHQTHHRGQVHDMLSQTAVPPPSLDLHRLIIPVP